MADEDVYKAQSNGLMPEEQEQEQQQEQAQGEAESTQSEQQQSADDRATAANANNIDNAANVAIKSGIPVAAAIGAAVKGADKITGGKVSQTAGKVLTEVNKRLPFGDKLQGVSNKLSESGVSDAVGAATAVDKNEQTEKAVVAGGKLLDTATNGLDSGQSSDNGGSAGDEKKETKKKDSIIKKIMLKRLKMSLILGGIGFLFFILSSTLIVLAPNLGSMVDLTSKGTGNDSSSTSTNSSSDVTQTVSSAVVVAASSNYDYAILNGTNELVGQSLVDKIGEDGVKALEEKITTAIDVGCSGRAVAAGTIALIDGLYEYGVRIPYYYQGDYNKESGLIDLEWGSKTNNSNVSPRGNVYYYKGLDSQGFISWAMQAAKINGGFNDSILASNDMKISLTSLTQGDIIGNKNHVMLVLENDGSNLVLAEATDGGVQYTKKTFEQCFDYDAIDMDSYYAANCASIEG